MTNLKKFSDIYATALDRKSETELEILLRPVIPLKKLAKVPDDRMLSAMCRIINRAGFHWSVIEKKWPGFEEAFHGFQIDRLCAMPLEQWEEYAQNKLIVRNWPKIQAVMENAFFISDITVEFGRFAKFLADWPANDQIGLMDYLKTHGSRLGGQTGQWFLRYVGWDSFVITKDVILALKHAGLDISDKPSSKRDLKKIQDAFNVWHEESGLPYNHIAKIAAYSIGPNMDSAYIAEQMDTFFPQP